MRTRKKQAKSLEFNDRDKLALFLVRMKELTGRKFHGQVDWSATPEGMTVPKADDDIFAAFLLSFRHFYANDSPTEMGKIHGILSRVAHTLGDSATVSELARIKVEFGKGPLFRFDVFDTAGKVIHEFRDEEIFDLYINCHYFHTDPRGAEFFFKMPEPSRTNCNHAFQLALFRYVRRFHAYVPLVVKVLMSSVLPVGRFNVTPVNQGQSEMVGVLVNVPKPPHV
jgi:hypothetical protein